MVYICTKYHENILNGFKSYGADTISILIITKWQVSVNIARRVIVLVLYISTNYGLYFVKIS